jgi:hypothetical protein
VTADETVALIKDAIGYAVAGDADRAADALQRLGENSDNNRMYGVCCALAAAGSAAMKKLYGPADGHIFWLESLTDKPVEDDPAEAFAARFLVAYANGDTDTCLALYGAALRASGEEYVESVCALLSNVAGIARLVLDKQSKNRSATTHEGDQ